VCLIKEMASMKKRAIDVSIGDIFMIIRQFDVTHCSWLGRYDQHSS